MEDNLEQPQTNVTWYYVIIQDPGTGEEQFVGYNDPKTDDKFIPAFQTKDHAKACFSLMPKDLFTGNYDTQAVIEEDLLAVAAQNGHKIYLLDDKGTIIDYLNE